MKKFFVSFLLILVAGVGIAGFGYWYWQQNQFSKEILQLEISGPKMADAGDEVEYLVKFKNNGKLRLEEPELIFEYPKNSIPQEGYSLRETKELDDIYPGEGRTISFRARVFGKENETLEAKALLTYQPKNLEARYDRKTSFTTQIESVPLTFEFDLPLKIEQEETIEFSLNYFSNVNYVLEDLRVRLEYPDDFQFLSAQPQALDETEWDLPSLSRGDGGKIEIKGIIEGEEGFQKIFHAQLGMIKDGEFILLKEVTQSTETITLTLYVSQLINGSQDYIAHTDDLLHYEIFFKNIGKKPIQKELLLVKLEGEFFDLSSLKSEKGEIGRGDNSIIWDWKVVPALRFLDTEEEGKVEFWVRVKEEGLQRKIENPVLTNKTGLLGGAQKVFETKINSEVSLSQKVYFEEEVFGNSGSLPPRAGASTTYTVFWHVKNSWNDLEKVKVKTRLPENVAATGKVFPEEANLTFDSKSKEVIWNIEDVEAFRGFDGLPLTLAFQIEFTPDDSQRDTTPLLVGEAEILGKDAFTGDIFHEETEGVDTTLPDDETVSEEQGIVQ